MAKEETEELKEELVEHEEEDDHRFELLERRIAERVQRHSDRRDVATRGGDGYGGGILSGRSDLEIILIVVLALVIGFVIAHIIHSLRKRPQQQGGEGCPFPHWAPPFAYQHQQRSDEEPERYHNLPILSHRRRDKISPRTPDSFLRDGIYLDENMEGCLLEEQNREVWEVVRNEFGKLIDAKRIDLDEDY